MKIKDTEYTNFLLQESEGLKKAKNSGSAKIKQSLNDSQVEEDDQEDSN